MGSTAEFKPLAETIMFQGLQLGALKLDHRVVQSPTTRMRGTKVAEGVWEASDLAVEYYSQRSSKGGFQLTEACPISRLSAGYTGVPGIFTPGQIASWKKVTDAVHAKGGFIYCQLWHVGRATVPSLLDGELARSASDIPIRGRDSTALDGTQFEEHKLHKMTVEDIKAETQEYVDASTRALEAGFDGVEIHGANGYLLDQFLNDNVNDRTDAYGGSIEKRARFTFEVIKAITSAIGADKTGIRLSPYNYYLDTKDSDPSAHWAYVCEQIANMPEENRLSYVHMVEPRFDEMLSEEEKMESLAGGKTPVKAAGIGATTGGPGHSLVPFAKILKEGGVKFITAGNFNRDNALPKLEAGEADCISFGRWFIANPDLPKRLAEGLPLNAYDRTTFYGADPPQKGYTDYPFYTASA